MKRIILSLFFLAFSVIVNAQELNPGYTFHDGQRITAAQLQTFVGSATILPPFYTDKVLVHAVGLNDTMLVYSASAAAYHQVTVNDFFTGTNLVLATLGPAISPYIDVSQLNFSNKLTAYSPSVPDFDLATNQVQAVVYDTNGVPHSLSSSNLLTAVSGELFHRFDLLKQFFYPWTMYGTNQFGTNAFGLSTNFPITTVTVSNLPTVLSSDTIPIMSGQQHTNTTITVGALIASITNLNALPAYTQARVQFHGSPGQMTISNNLFNTSQGTLFATNAPFLSNAPVAISLIINGGIPSTPLLTSNQIYYAVGTVTNLNYFRIFTNYTESVGGSNYVTIGSAPSGSNKILVLTNYTAFNADAIQIVNNTTIKDGIYDICFRNASSTTNYYVTGITCPNGSPNFDAIFQIDASNNFTTTKVRVATVDGAGGTGVFNRVSVLISPE